MTSTACLLINCADRRGLVAAIASFLFEHQANIIDADQHVDTEAGRFFMRVEWDLSGFDLPMEKFAEHFGPLARSLDLKWKVRLSTERPKTALLVSQQTHCLVDILHRHQIGELSCDIALILSNHREAERLAEFHRIPFHFVEVTPEKKQAAESRQLELLKRAGIELIVLARYMQILSNEFVARYPERIINVHHSFLPAFSGARPYQRAFERGVKLIGATSHYVTEALDEGPIIEQDISRISHRDALDDLVSKGRDMEKVVLSRAVKWHLEHRILVYDNKTVVFS